MRKIMMAVCDTDGSYGEKLGEWIALQKGKKIQSVSFSSPEHFIEYHSKHKQDIVLLGKGFCDNPQICEEALRKEEKALWMYLCDADIEDKVPAAIRELPSVEKYQPASGILREIFSVYQDWEREALAETGEGKEIIGVYSPGHSIWQTPFSLTFAQALSQRDSVLYVNFQECAGFCEWFHEDYGKDLLDVMYLCLNSEVNVTHCVSSSLYSLEGVDYIPPVEDSGCLAEISAMDYQRFVEILAKRSGYNVIILDFGMMLPGFFQLLGLCSKAYIVTEPGDMHKAPLQQFQKMQKRQAEAKMGQKLMYLSLPAVKDIAYPGEGKMQQWLWGTIGDFSRKLAGV